MEERGFNNSTMASKNRIPLHTGNVERVFDIESVKRIPLRDHPMCKGNVMKENICSNQVFLT